MKCNLKRHALLWAAITVAFPLATPAAEPGHDGHAAAAHQQVELNAGKKWETDMPLRTGMGTIREHVVAALPGAHAGSFTPAQYAALGKDINLHVADVVRDCKLEPAADAQLHVILGELAAGIETLEGKRGQDRGVGMVQAAEALNTYGAYFQHAGWRPIELPR